MEISKKSWHYRWLIFIKIYPQNIGNLCEYFWKLVFGSLFLVGILGAVLFALGFFYWKYCTALRDHAVATFFSSLLTVGILWYFIYTIRKPFSYKYKPPNIFKAWIIAKKKRICPRLNFID